MGRLGDLARLQATRNKVKGDAPAPPTPGLGTEGSEFGRLALGAAGGLPLINYCVA